MTDKAKSETIPIINFSTAKARFLKSRDTALGRFPDDADFLLPHL